MSEVLFEATKDIYIIVISVVQAASSDKLAQFKCVWVGSARGCALSSRTRAAVTGVRQPSEIQVLAPAQ